MGHPTTAGLDPGLFDAGLEGRLLVSQDVCLTSDLAAHGGPGYAYLFSRFRDRLLAVGLPESALTQLFQANPQRALAGLP